ncbi:MAG: electron transfer flavoprotein subunit beta/FixA family protein [Anaerolineales bacterium]|nr:electron transfer flavoprotein subunit beta/FixA family protein [Anaerolineales bacterium]
MKIIVCVKQVPDSAAAMSVEDGKISWGDAPLVINPWDEYAVEAALRLTEAQGGDVIALSLGDENAKEAIKHALAMGCSEAILVNDPAMAGADTQAVARVLAAAIQKIGGADIVVFGKQAIDSDVGATPSMVARLLGWPAVTLVSEIVECTQSEIKASRAMEEGRQQVAAELPVVLSIVKDYGEPRYPSFMGIRKAARASVPEWTVADTGIDLPSAVVTWPNVMAPPEREVTNEIIEGSNPEEIAAKLADKIMEEKVL